MRLKILFLILIGQYTFGQDKPIIFINDTHAYYSKAHKENFNNEYFIGEITLKTDSTFQFYRSQEMSCQTWHDYDGKWKKEKDSIFFYDQYEVEEDDVPFYFNRTTEDAYILKFHTDKNSELKNRNIKIDFRYDFESEIKDTGRVYIVL